MRVEFWFDPACPFCWMTSRWLLEVAPERALQIEWRPISLLLKNATAPDSPHYPRVRASHGILRLSEAIRAAGHPDAVGALYTEAGRRIHHDGVDQPDPVQLVAALGLDPALAAACDDERWDEPIRASMEDGLSLTGPDVGTPLIAIAGPRGRVGIFGPVIGELPERSQGLQLWDGVVALLQTPAFFELKRSRTGRPAPPPLART